jgi:hypothetical protein
VQKIAWNKDTKGFGFTDSRNEINGIEKSGIVQSGTGRCQITDNCALACTHAHTDAQSKAIPVTVCGHL